jgi:N-acetylmuramoyl-L-alanine amidase
MARSYSYITATTLVASALLAMAAGCQQQQSMIGTLPPPSFNAPGPAMATEKSAPALPKVSTPTAPVATKSTPSGPREWIPSAPARPWRWIVIHHSATPTGGAAAFDAMHRAKGWDELGYHFVIGNGTDTRDGQIEVGPRWPKQKWGAHAKTPDNRFNDYGIGICLVGNFDVSHPTDAQIKSVAKLTAYLMKTYHIPADRVLGHKDTKPTDCPGSNVHIAQIRQMATRLLADSGEKIDVDDSTLAADVELLGDQPQQ